MKKWYSIRMRSSKGGSHENGGQHISGAERLVKQTEIETTALEMIHRASNHTRGKADFISLKIETVQPNEIHYISPLRVKEVTNSHPHTAKKVISEQLATLPIQQELLFSLYDWVIHDEMTRGAIIVDINNGKRLDPSINRGIRVSHVDWDNQFKDRWQIKNDIFYNERRAEAIALSSKVAAAGTICEICCSDDPEYTTGYLSYQNTFIRVPNMKEKYSPRGGRVFIIDSTNIQLDQYIHFLEKTPVLIGVKE
ncbi:6-carboxyhexanoate--CoA ligase [Pseudogracilibacillus auburnensis]|uniref:6-carboxyhexanoate--CoA ligase n=1 Tax=Pseudogracilibacillus auburnensis TaxID=1494959 RepID=A0A2V3W500_9BACI|nr:6-carboxyhexanoate--CoA ligase [Pseudogracilibacillus auburnensis]PXW89433.1 6-carboxyhexanoate-CoA ligase [Pseudogracilibacillus auburnensis]